MITGDDFMNTLAIVGFLVFVLNKINNKLPLHPTPFSLKFLELDTTNKIIMVNDTKDSFNVTVRNDETEKAVQIFYVEGYDILGANLTPNEEFTIILMPTQSISGRATFGTAQISILVQ